MCVYSYTHMIVVVVQCSTDLYFPRELNSRICSAEIDIQTQKTNRRQALILHAWHALQSSFGLCLLKILSIPLTNRYAYIAVYILQSDAVKNCSGIF